MLKKFAQFCSCLPMPGAVLSVIDDASLQLIPNVIGLIFLTSILTEIVDSARELAKSDVYRYKNLSLEIDLLLRKNGNMDQNETDATRINNQNMSFPKQPIRQVDEGVDDVQPAVESQEYFRDAPVHRNLTDLKSTNRV